MADPDHQAACETGPHILSDAHAIATGSLPGHTAGAVWKLQVRQRHLDANIIHLQPAGQIEPHLGPDLDVLMLVLDGVGELVTETHSVALTGGALAWLPRLSHRSIKAGPTGLSYLTVHTRRPSLSIDPIPVT